MTLTNLSSNDLDHHFPKQISRTTRPPMLLKTERFKGAREFAFNL